MENCVQWCDAQNRLDMSEYVMVRQTEPEAKLLSPPALTDVLSHRHLLVVSGSTAHYIGMLVKCKTYFPATFNLVLITGH